MGESVGWGDAPWEMTCGETLNSLAALCVTCQNQDKGVFFYEDYVKLRSSHRCVPTTFATATVWDGGTECTAPHPL